MTRLWAKGDPIHVEADASGTPRRFTWRERRHRVRWVMQRWQADEDWWKRRVRREYFKLYTRTGLLAVVFHDLEADQWFLQRLYD